MTDPNQRDKEDFVEKIFEEQDRLIYIELVPEDASSDESERIQLIAAEIQRIAAEQGLEIREESEPRPSVDRLSQIIQDANASMLEAERDVKARLRRVDKSRSDLQDEKSKVIRFGIIDDLSESIATISRLLTIGSVAICMKITRYIKEII